VLLTVMQIMGEETGKFQVAAGTLTWLVLLRIASKGVEMIILGVTLPIKPERREEAVEIALKMVSETLKEKGCLAYTFHSPLDDPNTFFVYEEWETPESLDGHNNSEHMKVFQAAIGDVLGGGVTVKRYEVG
jgi:quinol monooxygenase YgiN